MKIIGRLLLIFILAAIWSPQSASADEVYEANYGREGQAIDPQSVMAPGRSVVIDFYSPYCPPCRVLSLRLEQLARKTHLVLMKLNINRPGVQGIDWQSPPGEAVWAENGSVLGTPGPAGQVDRRRPAGQGDH